MATPGQSTIQALAITQNRDGHVLIMVTNDGKVWHSIVRAQLGESPNAPDRIWQSEWALLSSPPGAER